MPSAEKDNSKQFQCCKIFFDRELKQLRRQRQRDSHKTIGFNKQDNALHVRFTFWYISLPFSAKQQREMTKFKVLWRT